MNAPSDSVESSRSVRIILWPGEGLVAEVETESGQQMFTLQGLQWHVMDLQKRGLPSAVEETALQMLSSASVDAG